MIFLDTSVIVAYKNIDDINHKKALAIFSRIGEGKYGRVVISEFIFSEVVTILSLRRNIKTAIEVGEILIEAKEIMMVRASEIFKRAWEIFKRRGNEFSFVDASTIACLEMQSINNIATFDKHFKKIKKINVINS